eukprot:symbB.v1.2.031538.t1/scaffold3672.1/size52204/2
MTKEYNSLVYETKAIEPVKLGDLEQESVEFVPGKLVTVRKAGPDGGKKKCRAVVCGNLLQGDLDPSPGSPYASGADGVLIRAALAFSVEKRWGIETTDIRTAHERLLEAFADISYAPEGDRSHQGIIICTAGSPIQWEATRQAFHTMSTSESELVGYCEATTMLKSTEALMKVIHGPVTTDDDAGFEKVIYGDNTSALSILTNPDGGWRTRHLRLRSACLRELLRDEPQNWKIRHQKGSDLPADMLTKPIVVQKDWARFWCFLGFHVDSGKGKVSSLNIENLPPQQPFHKSLVNPSELPEVSKECDDAKDSMLQLKVVAMIAALAAVASRRDVASKLEVACAAGAVAFARWLAEGEPTQLLSDRPKEVCSEGWEEEETIRAIGLQKVVKKSQDARGDEPAKTNLPRENEPGRKKDFSKENELEELRPDNQLALHKKEKEGESAKVGLKRVFVEPLVDSDDSFVEAYVEANLHGRAQQIAEDYDEHHGRGVLRLTEESSIHYCPSGCPRSEVPSGPFAMASLDEGPKVAALRIAPSLCGGDDSGLGGEPEFWEEKKFCEPPKHRKDEWLDCWLDRGWLVRSHGTERTRRFHPVHKGNPIHADLPNGDRVTIGFSDQDERKVQKDRWTNAPGDLYTPKKLWKGWTFLRLKQPLVSNLGQRFAGGVEGGFGNPRAATSGGAEIPTSSSGPGLSEPKRYLESAGSKPFPHEGEFHGDGKNESSLKKQARRYKKSGLVDNVRVVASQLCKPPGLNDKVGEWEEESDGEWERVSEAS